MNPKRCGNALVGIAVVRHSPLSNAPAREYQSPAKESLRPTPQQHALLEQLAAEDAAWPNIPPPPVPPLSPADVRSAAARQRHKAPGPDGWRGSELEHLPEAALQTARDLFAQVEAGQDWPAQLGHWKQVHLQKPNKELGALASLRPISLSSVWYRIWSGIRVRPWLAQVLPDEQHGSVRRKGVHTALALLELGKDPMRAGRDGCFRFIGAADLAKAYDSLGAEFCTRDLGRMGVPASLLQAWDRAWRVQGDAASPMALCAVISEALVRVKRHAAALGGQHLHRVYLDDRSWITSNADLCASIGRRWKHEMGHVGMAECRSKAEYAATGGLAAQTALQETLEQSGTVGTVVERPKVLGTRLQLTRAHTGPSEDETKRLNTAQYLILEAAALPVTRHQALFFAKSTGMAVATSCGWSRLPNLQELQKLQRAIDACHGDAHSLWGGWPAAQIAGAHQTLHLLMHLDGGLRDCWQSMRQNQGPIMMLRRWMERQGWNALEPWVWEHADAHSILDARLPAHRGNAAWLARGGRVVCSLPGQGKAHVAHVLRDAWHAQQWREFQDSGTKAAQAAGHLRWRDVEQRAVLVSKACEAAPPPLRPHMRAIAVGHWVSQARFQLTQGLAVDPCCYCGDAHPDRLHEWTCPGLRTDSRHLPPDPLFRALGWPRCGHSDVDASLLCELARVRARIVADRYPAPASTFVTPQARRAGREGKRKESLC
ncbi:Pol [Symbiodinium sp. CCMP2592]|nr:Pol [Symbiodinium sp. CCMP2592]